MGIISAMWGLLKATALLLVAGGASVIVASSLNDTQRYDVAGHHFDVPKDHLFQSRIFWLPAPEVDSFTFLLEPSQNPKAIPEHRVLVERLSRFCPGGTSPMLRIACGDERPKIGDGPPYVKVQTELGTWSSDLFSVKSTGNGETTRRPVAYCQLFEPNAAKPEPSTICTTFWAYKGMKLQFSFDERRASEMPALKAKAVALLDRWEVP